VHICDRVPYGQDMEGTLALLVTAWLLWRFVERRWNKQARKRFLDWVLILGFALWVLVGIPMIAIDLFRARWGGWVILAAFGCAIAKSIWDSRKQDR
jgi:hypothetical protein